MSLRDLFHKKDKKSIEKTAAPPAETSPEIYSGLRVEATDMSGRFLMAGKLMNYTGNQAELYQYSEDEPPIGAEPTRVRIRGYNDKARKAVYMEGTISPLPRHIWKVEELTVTRVGNDRAFFRLDVDLDAVVTTFGGFGSKEYHCRMLNISVGGVCIRTDHIHHEGDKFLLKAKLTEDRDSSVIFCQVMRVLDKGGGTFEYGCRFLELTESDEARITRSIFAAELKKRAAT